ncbi:BrnT family toxin [Haliea sp. E17]|uniref:BrnT family toxin n=1 Tax=Haliea sp. E17 TaxID=3401576 RepID=UPI003AAC7B0E
MKFQYDRRKSAFALKKHGIDFEQGQLLWDDPNLVELAARSDDEPRSIVIARFNGQYWSAVFAYRDEAIRLISVRRSRKAEVELYES